MTPPHWNEVSRATCEQLLAAVDAADRGHPLPGVSGVAEVLKRARNEARPALRTRAEVDAEIVRVVRSVGHRHWKDCGTEALALLVCEPLAAEAEANCPNSWDSSDDPDRCSCEEALALRERLASMVRICRGRAEQYSSGTITKAELEIVANELELALQ